MPRAISCPQCRRSYLIRDEFAGCQGRCACGRVHTVPTGPSSPAPTAALDSAGLMFSSVVLLLLSLGVGTVVTLWATREGRSGDIADSGDSQGQVAESKKPTPAGTSGEKGEDPPARPTEPSGKGGKDKKEREPGKALPGSTEEGASTPAGPRVLTQKELHKRLLRGHSVVWITHRDSKYEYSGTGSVIHRGRRLIITNRHVVTRPIENEQGQEVGEEVVSRVQVLFPQKDEGGEWITDKKYYEGLKDQNRGVMGRVLQPTSADPDLALIQLEGALPPDCVVLQVAPQVAEVGDNVTLVGNAGVSSGLWSLSPGAVKNRVPEVRMRKRFRTPGGEIVEREVVDKKTWCLETSIPSHHGDSGSPVLNDRGHLVGVHYGANPESNLIKYAVDRNEVLAFLAKFQIDRRDVEASDVAPEARPEVVNLIKQVEDGKPAVCRKGVDGLAALDPADARRAIPALIRALQRHEDEPLRRAITNLLNSIGPPYKEDLDCLGPALRVSYKPARIYVVDALKKLGTDARPGVPILAQALKDRDSEVRQKAAQVLGTLGPLARRQAFRALLTTASTSDKDEETAKAALDALISLDKLTSAEIELLIEALDDDKRWVCVRRYAALRLGEQGAKAAAAVPALTRALRTSNDDNLLMLSAHALGNIGERREAVFKALSDLLTSQAGEPPRREALGALGKLLEGLKPEQVAEVRPLLHHKEPAIVRLGLNVVVAKKSAAGLEADLAGLAKHANATIAVKAMETLRGLGQGARPAVPKLLEVLRDVPRARRLDVALAAAVSADDPKVAEAILPPLVEGLRADAIKERGEGSRSRIHASLQVAGQPAVDAIFSALDRVNPRGKDNIDYRKNLFVALEALGPSCKSRENYDRLKGHRDQELSYKYPDNIAAAQKALRAMDPD